MPRRKRSNTDTGAARQAANDRLVRAPLTAAEMRDDLDEFEESYLGDGADGLSVFDHAKQPSLQQQRSVLAFDDDDDDDDGEDDEYVDAYSGGEEASDDDDDANDDDKDDGMPSEHAWGREKRAYYGAQYVDESWRGAGSERALEMAEMEQQEALVIQQRMAQLLAGDDLQLTADRSAPPASTATPAEDLTSDEHVRLDISQLTSAQQNQLLMQKSPELLPLIGQLKTSWDQLISTAEPLHQLVADGYIVEPRACDYISCYRRLLLAHSLNIVHYLSERSHRSAIDPNHPVLRRIAQLTQLLNTLQPLVQKLKPDVDNVVGLVSSGRRLIKQRRTEEADESYRDDSLARDVWQKQRSVIQKEMQQLAMQADVLKKEKQQRKQKLQEESQRPPSFSELREAGKKKHHPLDPFRKKRTEQTNNTTALDQHTTNKDSTVGGANSQSENDTIVTSEKRPITNQIARNKGLMPKRSRESRNPRVKHKVKFQKALKKRRSMVRIPRTEVQKYGGEMCGIRVGTIQILQLIFTE